MRIAAILANSVLPGNTSGNEGNDWMAGRLGWEVVTACKLGAVGPGPWQGLVGSGGGGSKHQLDKHLDTPFLGGRRDAEAGTWHLYSSDVVRSGLFLASLG